MALFSMYNDPTSNEPVVGSASFTSLTVCSKSRGHVSRSSSSFTPKYFRSFSANTLRLPRALNDDCAMRHNVSSSLAAAGNPISVRSLPTWSWKVCCSLQLCFLTDKWTLRVPDACTFLFLSGRKCLACKKKIKRQKETDWKVDLQMCNLHSSDFPLTTSPAGNRCECDYDS